MNWPTSPYHDGHAYRRGSALNAHRQVLVHADRYAEVVIAEANRVRRERQCARRGRGPVVDVGERDAGEPEQRDDRVGVVDLVAAGERELDVAATRLRRRRARGGLERPPCRWRSGRGSARTGAARPPRSQRLCSSAPCPSSLSSRAGTRTSRPRCRRRRCGTAPASTPSPCRERQHIRIRLL